MSLEDSLKLDNPHINTEVGEKGTPEYKVDNRSYWIKKGEKDIVDYPLDGVLGRDIGANGRWDNSLGWVIFEEVVLVPRVTVNDSKTGIEIERCLLFRKTLYCEDPSVQLTVTVSEMGDVPEWTPQPRVERIK